MPNIMFMEDKKGLPTKIALQIQWKLGDIGHVLNIIRGMGKEEDGGGGEMGL